MIGTLIGFELKRRLKMPSSYVYAAILGGGGMFLMAANAGLFRSISASTGNEKIHANGPFAIYGNLSVMALLGLFTVAAVFGQAIYEDFGTGAWPLIFTRNVSKARYLLGRFLGAWLFAAALFTTIGLGMAAVAVVAGFVDGEQLGPHSALAYLWPYLVGVWPMLFISGAVFFSLAALSRQMAPVYVGVVVLVLGYFALNTAMTDVSNRTVAGLLDPFGLVTFETVTRYWTPAEKNAQLVPLTGVFLLNRLLWVGGAAALLAFTVLRFRPLVEEQRSARAERDETPAGPLPTTRAHPTRRGWAATALSSGWMQFRDVTKSPVFWSFQVAGLTFVLIALLVDKQLFGTPTLPLTWQVLELAQGAFGLFLLITVTFYAGELVWKERDAQVADVIDATRAPTWVFFCSKLMALLLIVVALHVVMGLAALTAQISRGFFDIEWRLYVTELFFFGVLHALPFAVLALTVQVVVNHKYLGHGVMVLYFVSRGVLAYLGVEEPLARFGAEPGITYSDLNRYGHWLPAVLAYRGYWYGVASVLVVLSFALLVRGREPRRRGQVARRLTLPWKLWLTAGVLLAAGLGAFTLWETRVKNRYVTSKEQEQNTARYEKDWKAWADKPMPRIVDVDLKFDVFPSASPPRLDAAGTMLLENKSGVPIDEVLVSFDQSAKSVAIGISNARTPVQEDLSLGLRVYRLEPPMQPGERRPLEFTMRFESSTFAHDRDTEIVNNGTFFHNGRLPVLGYQPDAELSNDGDRKAYELPPKERMLDRDDPKGLAHNYIRRDSDFVRFRATVSTDADQIAVTPGKLTREWREGERRFFRYEVDSPILNFVSVLSARYALLEDQWKGVKLQIFHHPTHTWNTGRMMQAMKDALEYCSTNFSPYQFEQARIFEFPRYQLYAQSFPNTVPYSEGIGFIARVREDDPDDVDYPYYVTAHEIAHQWWAHQVVGGDVQGATMTSETMAQYSALMVMKHHFGEAKMRRFLKYELDQYLMGRAIEQKKEVPLSRVENQPYIHYRKGSLVMYWLQDLAGEAVLNRALHKYVEAVQFRGPPYTNSAELLKYVRAELPAELQPVIDDLFERIVLYDNRTTSASATQNPDGTWAVTVKVTAVKYLADEKGEQQPIDFDDLLEVGGLDEHGESLAVQKVKVHQGDSELTFTAPKKPARAGIDPLNKLIDRTSDDNTAPVD